MLKAIDSRVENVLQLLAYSVNDAIKAIIVQFINVPIVTLILFGKIPTTKAMSVPVLCVRTDVDFHINIPVHGG
jgi:hypothetical protein